MPGRQARVLTEPVIRRALQTVRGRPDAPRSRAMLLLSLRAGLRAGEIAGLDWSSVLDSGDVWPTRWWCRTASPRRAAAGACRSIPSCGGR